MVNTSDYTLPVNAVEEHDDKNFESASMSRLAARLPSPWDDLGPGHLNEGGGYSRGGGGDTISNPALPNPFKPAPTPATPTSSKMPTNDWKPAWKTPEIKDLGERGPNNYPKGKRLK